MSEKQPRSQAAAAVLTLAEIKSATAAFDRGEANLFDALDSIGTALDDYRSDAASRRDAA